ncbi:MAG: DUF262 domain-containing protein [Fluviicola sp.]
MKKNKLTNSEEELDMELEGTDPSADEVNSSEITSPFDPKKIKITVEQKTIDNLVQRIKFEELDMNTEFQRKGNLWETEKQSKLIESILLRFPLPAFFFDAQNDESWLVVDGLQRLWSFKRFIIDNAFSLTGLEILTEYSDKGITFDKLNRTMQRRILETQVTAYIIQPGTPKEVKYNVFRRINTGGLVLNSMEIRHALNQGPAADLLREMSEDEKFTDYISVRSKRMEDREIILRAISFILFPYTEYSKPLSGFLDKAMEEFAKIDDETREKIKQNFYHTLELSYGLFEDHAFSRSLIGTKYRLNSALFETWVALLSQLNEQEIKILKTRKQDFIDGYKKLLEDNIFTTSIVSSTSGKSAVETRFSAIKKLIKTYST